MRQFLLPIINLAIATALFFLFTNNVVIKAPLVEKQDDVTTSTGGVQALLARQSQLNDAIDAANKLKSRVNELNQKYNSFDPNDVARLDQLLPDNVNNIQLIIDVNGIARKNGMSIKNVKVDTSLDKSASVNSQNAAAVKAQSPVDSRLGVMTLSFSITGSYDIYKKFLTDLASSLRIIDISSTSFNTDDKGIYNYDVTLKTYWLK